MEELGKKWEDALRRYAELLAGYGAARITGTRDAGELYELHVRDSLYSAPLLPEKGRVIDVGSGGGLPGMVWAVCRPDLAVTMLDSVGKKCRAMREIAAALGLSNVSVVWGRCEEHASTEREKYAFASARALGHAGLVAEYLAPLVQVGGRLAAFKGPKAEGELEEVGGGWETLGLSKPCLMPYGDGERNYRFVIWEKISCTPSEYPRKPGSASVKNWWER